MSNYVRPKLSGVPVFFTVTLAERGTRLLVDEIVRLRAAVAIVKEERPFDIDAWVVLPDHIHAVWTLPDHDRDFATRWGAIKARFSMGMDAGRERASHIKRREKAVWQRRYWEHHVRDQADFDTHIRYCWINPVKHGLVEKATDWPFSSIHRDVRLGRVEREWSGVVTDGEFGE